MWRRLLWVLLGKLCPEAQALYATYLAMCPHCPETDMWRSLVTALAERLWSPSPFSLPELALVKDVAYAHRRGALAQYARALNTAFVESYHPSTTLLAKQVLLALSPLHHQVLSPPELAPFLPSSFAPSIGKALMGSLFEGPVLDGYAHEACQVQPWHVWWHVGLRRYAALERRQQEQQQQQEQAPHAPSSSGGSCHSSSSSGSDPLLLGASAGLSAGELEGLYLDHDARLYAVSFASRQLAGCQQQLRSRCTRDPLQRVIGHEAARLIHGSAQRALLLRSFGGSRDSVQLAGSNEAARRTRAISSTFIIPCVLPPGLVTAVKLQGADGPQDPLVPVAQQKRPLPGAWEGLLHMVDAFGGLYLRLGAPEDWAQYERRHARGLQGGAAPVACASSGGSGSSAGPARPQQRPQQYAVATDDVADLAQPLPGTLLADPAMWWGWHQELAGMHKCDVCDREAPQAVTCPECRLATYCGAGCQSKDAAGHAAICDLVQQAHKRYSIAPSSGCDGGSQQAPAAAPGGPASPPCTPSFGRLAPLLHAQELELQAGAWAPVSTTNWGVCRQQGQQQEGGAGVERPSSSRHLAPLEDILAAMIPADLVSLRR